MECEARSLGVSKRYAAMDLGTNSARLAVVEVDERGAWHLIADHRIACRLGEDLKRSGRLQPAAMDRALAALRELTQLCHELGSRPRAVATYALRTAANGRDFRRRVAAELGLDLEILSGEDEARMVLRGARRHAPDVPFGGLMVLDLGGGSLELAREAEPAPLVVSMPLGAVLASAELPIPATAAALRALRAATRSTLEDEARVFAATGGTPFAAGGTVTTAARLRGDEPPLTGRRLDRDELEAWLARLAPLDLEARTRVPRLEHDRADIIVSGLAVVCETMEFLAAASIRVHEQGVREGLLLAMIEADRGTATR
jgi:exopolyphosphatase/guanosine-5'-triphosphate,3'-diphosphate pyrophosphatase